MELKKPRRLFTFGCSFTDYKWVTWANILGYELGCEFYNFARSGAGNNYITNTLAQADSYFNFCSDDLIVVCWTNISREDRWITNQGWLTPGNIYTQNEYDSAFVKKWANETHFGLRDFSNIHLVKNLLENKQVPYKFISMCDLNQQSQWEVIQERQHDDPVCKISRLYQETLEEVSCNFYDVLWNNDIFVKFQKDRKIIHQYHCDGHPTPEEHLELLQHAFEYQFTDTTLNTVKDLQTNWVEYLQKCYSKTRKDTPIHELPDTVEKTLRKEYKLRVSDKVPDTIFH